MRCPKCGSNNTMSYEKHIDFNVIPYVACHDCGWRSDKQVEIKPDPNNPYTDFAKEMSLLHEALKAEGFRDAMVEIVAMMTPVVWDKVEKRRIHENLKKAVDELEKQDYKPPAWITKLNEENQKREDEDWKAAREKVGL